MISKCQTYDPNGIVDKVGGWDEDDMANELTEPTVGLFHVTDYKGEPAKILRCRKCNANTFTVAQGAHYTAIRCDTCQYEVCIHDG